MEAQGLPPRPSIDRYRQQAKDLLEASGTETALTDIQMTIALEHGFESWAHFAEHVGGLGQEGSPIARFEAGVDAVITGDVTTLASILHDEPDLLRARSLRRHHGTLLHYVSANGVEDFRQTTPPNAVQVAEILLRAGAEVDADLAEQYRGSTTLGLVATSVHPARVGVADALVETLLNHGAAIDGLRGAWRPLDAALVNGRLGSAETLARLGAEVTIVGAGGLGRIDLVEGFFDQHGSFRLDLPPATQRGEPRDPEEQMEMAFVCACAYGRTAVADLLLGKGVDLVARDPQGQTGLHLAAAGGYLETVSFLLAARAALEMKNSYGGTVLDQVLWSAANAGSDHVDYVPIVQSLIDAGARVDPTWATGQDRIDAVLRR